MTEDKKSFWQSKRLWTVLGIAAAIGAKLYGVDDVTINQVVDMVMVLVGAMGVAEGGKALAKR